MKRAGIYFPGLTARGGAERLALTTALALNELGWEVAVYTDVRIDRRQLATDLGQDVSSLRFFELPRSKSSLPREVGRLLAAKTHALTMRRHNLDLFINAHFKSQVPGCGQRNIYYCHFPHKLTPFASHGIRGLYQRLTAAADRFLVSQAPSFLDTYDDVWANSQFTAGHVFERWGRAAKVLYPACEQGVPGAKEKLIAVVGRFQAPTPGAPYKAQDVLLEQFSGMTDLHQEGWQLHLLGGLGDGEADQAYYRRLAAAAEGLPIVLQANATHQTVRELYSRASLYWHAQGFGTDPDREPQTQEHFGITTVEAMSAGAIPVVIDTAGPREVVLPVQGVGRWTTLGELRDETRRLVATGPDSRDTLSIDCVERARMFDGESFVRRLRGLVGLPSPS